VKNRFLLGVLFCLGAVLSWGGMFPVMGSALKVMNPFLFTAIRYSTAGVMFVAFLAWREGRGALRPEGHALALWVLGSRGVGGDGVLGALGFAGYGFLVFLGQKLAGPSGALSASVMMALMPMLSILFNWLLRGIPPLRWSPVFVAMSFTGVLFVVTRGDFRALAQLQENVVADVLILFGAACWVIYTIGATFFPTWSAVRYTALTTSFGVPTILVVNVALFFAGRNAPVSGAALASLLPHFAYMVVVAGFLGVLFWNSGNKIVTPINGVLFMDVVPMTTFAISALRGYRFSASELVGVSLTISALILNNVYQRMAMARAARKAAPPAKPEPVPVYVAGDGDQAAA
jgi:drug/metabolite transporter (DMT)-like permease